MLVLTTVLGLVAGFATQSLAASRDVTQYQAEQVIVGNRDAGTQVNVEQDALRVNRGEVLDAAAAALGEDDPDALAKKVQVDSDVDSNSIQLRVFDVDPQRASSVVQAFADSFLTVVNADLRSEDQRLLDELTGRAETAQQALADFDAVNGFISRTDVPLPQTPTIDALVAERQRLDDAFVDAQQRLDTAKLEISQREPYSSLGPEAPRVADSQLLEVPSSVAFRMGLLGLIGFLLGCGLVVLVERVNRRVDTREELGDLTRVPIIAEVGRIRTSKIPKVGDSDVLSLEGVWSEHYRRVRSAVQFVQANPSIERVDQLLNDPAPASAETAARGAVISSHVRGPGEVPRVFMVVSALPSEGKSTTAALTAMALAESGTETVAINADFRRPRLGEYLGAPSSPSLRDAAVLSDSRATVDQVVLPSGQSHLWSVASGPPTTEVGGRLQATREVAAEAARRGATVVIDSSPLRVSNDPIDLLPVVDEVILVVRAGKSTVKSLEDTLEQLQMHHAPVMGIILIGTSGSREMYAYYSSYYTSVAAEEERRTGGPGTLPGSTSTAPPVNGQVAPPPNGQVAPYVNGQVAPPVNGQVNGQVAPQVNGQVAPQVNGQVAPQVNGQVAPQVNGQVVPQVNGYAGAADRSTPAPQAAPPPFRPTPQ